MTVRERKLKYFGCYSAEYYNWVFRDKLTFKEDAPLTLKI